MYRIVKIFGGKKSLANKDCRKFSELKSICIAIGNIMEIVKIGAKTWRIGVIRQSFYCQCFLLYGMMRL